MRVVDLGKLLAIAAVVVGAGLLIKRHFDRRSGQTAEAFFQAVVEGDVELAAKLIDEGANVNAPNDQGLYPLHIAVRARDAEMVRLLLENGADRRLALPGAGRSRVRRRPGST